MPRKKGRPSKSKNRKGSGNKEPTEEELSSQVVRILKEHFNIESTQDLVSVVNRLAAKHDDHCGDPYGSELSGKDEDDDDLQDPWDAYRMEVLDIIEDRLNQAPMTKKFKVELGEDHLNMIEYNYPTSPAIRRTCREILLKRGLHPKEKFGFHIDWSNLAIRCFPNGAKVKKANGRHLAKRDFEKTFVIPLDEIYDLMIQKRSTHCSWCSNPFTEKDESIMVYPYSDYFPPELLFVCEVCLGRFLRNVRKRNITSPTGIRFSEELFNLAQEFCYAMTDDDDHLKGDKDVPEDTFFSILGLLAMRQMDRDLKMLIEEMESDPALKDVKPSQMMEILEGLPYWSELARRRDEMKKREEGHRKDGDKASTHHRKDRELKRMEDAGLEGESVAFDEPAEDEKMDGKKKKKVPGINMYQ